MGSNVEGEDDGSASGPLRPTSAAKSSPAVVSTFPPTEVTATVSLIWKREAIHWPALIEYPPLLEPANGADSKITAAVA
jgi:hypothetical protein